MQTIQIYIQGQRLDLFEDESVDITDTIKNAKQIDKVFTEYSQTFSLPATKINNKIFKHYYNNSIVGGFDARVRIESNIELNNLNYKDGYIKLEGVDLKNNKPHTYKVTFFGNTVSLKNLIGDDLLSNLNWLSNFDFEEDVQNPFPLYFKPSDMERFLTANQDKTVDGVSYSSPVQVPLMTHSQRLYYNSSLDTTDDGNLNYDAADTNYHGVKWNELKYALKVPIILKAIEEKYTINFSTDFLNDSNDSINELYMWMHRAKGQVTNGEQLTSFNYSVASWANDSNDITSMSGNALTLEETVQSQLTLKLKPSTGFTTIPYSFNVYKGGSIVYSSGSVSGTQTNSIPIFYGDGYTVQITITSAINFDFVEWFTSGFDSETNGTLTKYYTTPAISISEQFEFNMLQQIPKMKVLDFLTAIFKMFNLVTYIQDGNVIVKTLDSFYASGSSYDITKYLDVNTSQINTALPFREVVYTYEGLGTYLAEVHNQLFNKEWGKIEYSTDVNTKFSGGIFNYTIPFEHMKFENLYDIDTSTKKDIQWGYCVDDNQESFIGKPILFYMALKTANISFVDSVKSENVASSSKQITSYFAPCNSNMNVAGLSNQPSLNFAAEQDEFLGQENLNTLFQDYHSNYVSGVFKESNRITKVNAFLPLRILLKYTLADEIIISGKSYKINSIKTNLKTGKSNLELLNSYD